MTDTSQPNLTADLFLEAAKILANSTDQSKCSRSTIVALARDIDLFCNTVANFQQRDQGQRKVLMISIGEVIPPGEKRAPRPTDLLVFERMRAVKKKLVRSRLLQGAERKYVSALCSAIGQRLKRTQPA